MAYFGTETNRLQKPAYKRTVKFQRDLYIYCKQPFMSQAGQIISPWKLLDVFSDVKWIWKNFKNSEYCHHSSTWKYTDTVRRNNMFAPLETGLKNVFQNLSTEFRLKNLNWIHF